MAFATVSSIGLTCPGSIRICTEHSQVHQPKCPKKKKKIQKKIRIPLSWKATELLIGSILPQDEVAPFSRTTEPGSTRTIYMPITVDPNSIWDY